MIGEPTPTPPEPADNAEQPAQSGGNDRQLWYRIELSEHSLRVRLRLLRPPEHAHFFVPTMSDTPSRLGERFHISYARGPDQRRSYRIHRRRGRIDVEAGEAPWIEIVYRVNIASSRPDGKLPPPYVSNGVLLAYAPTFLIVPSRHVARSIRQIPVEVHVPATWQMLSTWAQQSVQASNQHPDRRVYGFVPRDLQRLRDAYLAGGVNLDRRQVDEEERRIDIAFDPSYRASRNVTQKRIVEVVEYYRRRFGRLGPVAVYVQSRGPSREGRRRGTSRRGGFVVALPSDRPPGPRASLLIAHEAFHLWNGHALVPDPDRSEETRWFLEGVTQYVALKAVRRLGRIGLEEALDELAHSASAYLHNTTNRRGGATRLDRRRLPYDRGLLLGFAFDAALARTSGDQIGIETWFRTLLESQQQERATYDLDTLERALQRISRDQTRPLDIWQSHIERERRLPPRAIFRSAGLKFTSEASKATLDPLPSPPPAWSGYRTLLPGPKSGGERTSLERSHSSTHELHHE